MHWKMFLLWPFLLGISALQCWDKPKNKEFATLSEKGGGVHFFFCSQAVGSGVAAVGDGVVSGVTAVQEVGPKNPLTKNQTGNLFRQRWLPAVRWGALWGRRWTTRPPGQRF